MFKNLLPTFKTLEPELLKGQYAGAYVAQRPVKYTAEGTVYGVATVEKNGAKFIENGVICGLDADGYVVNYAKATAGAMFIHYTEELPTIVKANNTFAVECKGAETYIRLIELFVGDEFVTDNVAGTYSETNKYADITNGILTFGATGPFVAEADTLPNGDAAYRFVYTGVKVAE